MLGLGFLLEFVRVGVTGIDRFRIRVRFRVGIGYDEDNRVRFWVRI